MTSTTSTTTSTSLWQPPGPGVFVRAADVPSIKSVTGGSLLWAYVAAQCREYDATHGTASSITVEPEPAPSMGRPEADTPCLDGNGGWAVAH